MSSKTEIIFHIYNTFNENKYKKILIFTKYFKANGTIIKNNNINNLITLNNVSVCCYNDNSSSTNSTETKLLPWLNVFCKDIIAFAFVE